MREGSIIKDKNNTTMPITNSPIPNNFSNMNYNQSKTYQNINRNQIFSPNINNKIDDKFKQNIPQTYNYNYNYNYNLYGNRISNFNTVDTPFNINDKINNNNTNINSNNMNNFPNINNNLLYGKKKQNYSKSIELYKELLSHSDYKEMLSNSKRIEFEKYSKIPMELNFIDYFPWIINFKSFLAENLLKSYLNYHEINIENLNRELRFLQINLIDTMPMDESDSFEDYLNYIFNDLNSLIINFSNSNISNNNPQTNMPIKYFFFGDTSKIKALIYIIELKIREMQIENNKLENLNNNNNLINKLNGNSDLISDSSEEKNQDENTKLFSDYCRDINPYIKEKTGNDYKDLIFNNKKKFYNKLKQIKQLLIQRLVLNENLYPKEFNLSNNEVHSNLITEYSINRLREIKYNINLYSNNCGGKFNGQNWCSALPTDSQLISHITIKYLQDLFTNKGINKNLLINHSLPPILIKDDNNNLYIYQNNPKHIEPYFCVIFQDMIIPCEVNDNFFQCFVIFLYFMKIKQTHFLQNMNLDNFIKTIIH